MQVTQLGHVKDLAVAFNRVLLNPVASKQIYNISGERYVCCHKCVRAHVFCELFFCLCAHTASHTCTRYVTFDGIARACAEAMGITNPELVHFNPKDFDFGKKKSFPMRDQHFFASVDKVVLHIRDGCAACCCVCTANTSLFPQAMRELEWRPEYGLVDGLRDSYAKDFGRGTFRKEADFSVDDMILEKVKGRSYASAW